MKGKDARLPYGFQMDAFAGMSRPSRPATGALPLSQLTTSQNPPFETLVDGLDDLGISSPGVRTPRRDVPDGDFNLGYGHGYGIWSEDRWDCLDLSSRDGCERNGSLESDALTTRSDGVDRDIWYPRFHEYGSYPRMSGSGIAAAMISYSNIYPAISSPGLSCLELMRRSDAFRIDQGTYNLGDFSAYPRDLLRWNLNVGRSTGMVNASPWCSSLALCRARIRDMRGRLSSIAKSHAGHKILLEKMKDMKSEETEIIFCDLVRDLVELMVDPFANRVIQKLVEVCSDGQRAKILSSITRNPQLIRICLDQYGALVIEKLLEILTPDWQKREFTVAIHSSVVQLTKNTNGHLLILRIMKVFPTDCNQVLLDQLNDKFYEIATDQHGCRVLSKHVQNVKGDQSDRMVAETVAHAFTLSEHRYGNYVVQALLDAEMPQQLLHDIHQQFMGSYSALSRDKFASNVVEKCLARAEDMDFMQIVCELLDDFLLLLGDKFANYVIQKMTWRSKALGMPIYGVLVDRMRTCRPLIEASLYGRKALDRLTRNNHGIHT